MSRIKRMTASLGAVALIVTAGLAAASSGPAHAASGAAVSVTETTTDQSQLLAQQTGATFAPGSSGQSQVITVNPSTTYQSMTGFGASFTDSSAWLVYNSPLRNEIMTKLFDPNQGIGLDFLRQPIGASDFSQSMFSYDDVPSGQTDPTLADFSIAHDESYIIPILQQALSINPTTTVMATPWSPPGWMKTSGSMVGGTLNTADYQVFANYLVKFIQAYDAAGVPISLITAQNEPEYSPSNYPGSTFTSTQEADFIADNLGPAMSAAGLSTGILDYDHNWNDPSFPETVLGDSSAAQYVTGTAWHCYSGDPSAQSTVEAVYPSYGTYETECSGTQASAGRHLRRHARLGGGEPGHRRDPQLQQVRRDLEHGAQPQRRPVDELHHLHRARDRRQHRRHRDLQRRVLQPRTGQQVRQTRRGAHRLQHLRVRQRRGRRLPEPRRVDGAGRAELEHLELEHLRGR